MCMFLNTSAPCAVGFALGAHVKGCTPKLLPILEEKRARASAKVQKSAKVQFFFVVRNGPNAIVT